jgi:hypothetical protein
LLFEEQPWEVYRRNSNNSSKSALFSGRLNRTKVDWRSSSLLFSELEGELEAAAAAATAEGVPQGRRSPADANCWSSTRQPRTEERLAADRPRGTSTLAYEPDYSGARCGARYGHIMGSCVQVAEQRIGCTVGLFVTTLAKVAAMQAQ